MNPLDQYPKVRQALYLIQWIASGVLLVVSAVVMIVTQGESPVWLTATTAGFNAFTVYTGLTAQRHVEPTVDEYQFYDDDEEDIPYSETP